MNLNPKQFRQQRLFAPLGMTKQPHQQSPLEFANSPRTWWHASDSEDFEDLRSGRANPDDEEQGFHVGTLAAAEERIHTRQQSTARGYFHPVRFQESSLLNSKDHPVKQTPFGTLGVDQGDDWSDADKPQFYKNAYEDKGSTSAVLGSPDDVKHHADYVHDALDRGGIPSAQAEYFATRLDSAENQYSPGFPRSQFVAETTAESKEGWRALHGPRRLRPRDDGLLDPVSQAHRALGMGKYERADQPEMLREADTYDEAGNRTGTVLAPAWGAVPPENRQMVEAQDEARKAPWYRMVERRAAEERR